MVLDQRGLLSWLLPFFAAGSLFAGFLHELVFKFSDETLNRPSGGFTERILPRLMPGDTLALEGPQGACVWPAYGWPADIEHLVLLATGTGYAGIHPILMEALRDPRFKRVTLYWGGRTEDDCYAGPLLNALQGKGAGFAWHAVLSEPPAAQAAAPWHVQDAALAADHDWTRTVVYACGNPAMVRAAYRVL